tara:strand:+ start:476 stop:1705 length:1230 start_codon:yes stop_codon:yes gene_type:complete
MTISSLNRTDADAVLKDFYLPGVRSVLNNEVFLLSQMEMNTEDVEGRAAVVSINVGRNQGVGARAEGQALPSAGAQQYAEQRVQLKYNYGRIQLTGPVIRSMGSDRGSFVRAVQSETNGVVRDLRNDVNRQTFGDGSGTIALTTGTNTGAVITLTATANQMRLFARNMLIDIGSVAGTPADVGTTRITSIDRAAKTITVSPTIATTDADLISRTGSGETSAPAVQREITGLKKQVSATGALWNINPADWADWASYEKTSAGAVSEDMFIEASQEVNLDSGEQLDTWVTTAEVHRGVAGLLTSLKRFPTTNDLKGGYTGLDMSDISQGNTGSNTVSMVYDKDLVEDGVAYGLTMRRWQNYRMSDWEFMQDDGAILNRVPNTDAYEGTLFCYSEMATDGRNANAKISGITV